MATDENRPFYNQKKEPGVTELLEITPSLIIVKDGLRFANQAWIGRGGYIPSPFATS